MATFSPNVVGKVATRKIDAAAVDHLRDAAVLRQPLLGDVEAAEHLDAADERRVQLARNRVAWNQHAVDAMPDPDRLILGLDVQVGRAFGNRVVDDQLQQPHDRRIARSRRALRGGERVHAFLHQRVADVRAVGVAALEQIAHVLRRRRTRR